jgi:transcriptional regulator with XRE-family HTH domain
VRVPEERREGSGLNVSRTERARPEMRLFATELAAARMQAGLTQEELAEKIHFSASTIAMVEACHRPPTVALGAAIDRGLGTPGTYERLAAYVRSIPLPWFAPWVEAESVATTIRCFELAVVPGLLQTDEYARGILSTKPNTTDDVIDELVAARMNRQQILDRDEPPLLWIVMGEAVLHGLVGTPAVMQAQLQHLTAMAGRPNITIGIIPASAGAHVGLLGAFAVAEGAEKQRVGYLETVTNGVVAEDDDTVAELLLTFDTLRAEALPRGASRDLILKEAERWTS